MATPIRKYGLGLGFLAPCRLFRHNGIVSGSRSARRNESAILRVPTVPVRREKVDSFRIENHVVIGTANEDPLEEHGW